MLHSLSLFTLLLSKINLPDRYFGLLYVDVILFYQNNDFFVCLKFQAYLHLTAGALHLPIGRVVSGSNYHTHNPSLSGITALTTDIDPVQNLDSMVIVSQNL